MEKPVEGRLALSVPDGKNIAEERIVIAVISWEESLPVDRH